MTVALLLADVAAHAAPFLAVVSEDLFVNLQVANELGVALHRAVLPSDPKYGAIIDAWIEAQGINPNAPINVPDFYLTRWPQVHVRLDADYGLALTPTGPRSFRIS